MTFEQMMTLVAVVGTGVGTTLIQIYRESRNRRWDIEDRELARREIADKLTTAEHALAAKLVQAERDLAVQTAAAQRVLVEKIEENTEMSRVAFAASNNFDAKADKLEQAYDRVAASVQHSDDAARAAAIAAALAAATAAAAAKTNATALPTIKHTGEDTNERVRVIEEKQEALKTAPQQESDG